MTNKSLSLRKKNKNVMRGSCFLRLQTLLTRCFYIRDVYEYFSFQVENLVSIELSYINTNHPDFTDGASLVSNIVMNHEVVSQPWAWYYYLFFKTEERKARVNTLHTSKISSKEQQDLAEPANNCIRRGLFMWFLISKVQ